LSKQIVGIAVAVAFAFGLATTGTAFALPSGTQVEFKVQTLADDALSFRAYAVAVVAEEFIYFGL
jgi:hypothetical protein